MKKTILAITLIALTVLCCFLSGCGKSNEDELILWWPSGRASIEILDEALARFKAEHPDITIKVVYKDVDCFDAYKIVLNDDKTRPDVAILDHVYVQALAADHQLADLTALGSESLRGLYPEGVYNANLYNGNAYALPFSANTVVLMYNKDILKSCGIVDELGNAKAPTTMEELLADCAIIEGKGYIPFAQPQNSFSAMEFASYVARNGGAFCSDDYKTVKLNSPEVKAAVENWKALSAYANPNSYEEDKFYNGKVAFVEMGSWALSKVMGSGARFDCGFAEMVTIRSDVTNYSGLGLYSLCIAEKSADKAGAYALASFLSTDSKVQLAYNREKNLFPVTKECLGDKYYTDNPALSVYAAQLNKVAPRPGTPVWPDMESAVVNMLVSVVRDNKGQMDAILERYQIQVQQATDRHFK